MIGAKSKSYLYVVDGWGEERTEKKASVKVKGNKSNNPRSRNSRGRYNTADHKRKPECRLQFSVEFFGTGSCTSLFGIENEVLSHVTR